VVKLYAHGAECKECVVVRKFLTNHAIPFDEFDIDRSSRALQELVDLTGSAPHVSVIVVNQETFVDFDDEIASRVLELAGK
jgi:arsenate reductase-like glutaredoxin family protein